MRGTYDVKVEAVFGIKALKPECFARLLELEFDLRSYSGVYEANLGAKPRPALNCVNCGAPHQAGDRCDYCLTRSEAMP